MPVIKNTTDRIQRQDSPPTEQTATNTTSTVDLNSHAIGSTAAETLTSSEESTLRGAMQVYGALPTEDNPLRANLREEDFTAPAEKLNALQADHKGQVDAQLRRIDTKDFIEKRIRSACAHGALGYNARDIMIARALDNFKKEAELAGQGGTASNILFFCPSDIACDDMARRMLRYMPLGLERQNIAAHMEVLRNKGEFDKALKQGTETGTPRIIFVHTKTLESVISSNLDEKDRTDDNITETLKEFSEHLGLETCKYLYLDHADIFTRNINERLFGYLISTIRPSEEKPLELLGTAHYKPQRGDEDHYAELSDIFSGTIHGPCHSQLRPSGLIANFDEESIAFGTAIGLPRPGRDEIKVPRGRKLPPHFMELKYDYVHTPKFYDEVFDQFIKQFGKDGRNLVRVEDEAALKKLMAYFKRKRIPYAVVTRDKLFRYANGQKALEKHSDFNNRIEAWDRLGTDYQFLVTKGLSDGLEIPVDNLIDLTCPARPIDAAREDHGDHEVEAHFGAAFTPYPKGSEQGKNNKGLFYLEMAEPASGNNPLTNNKSSLTEILFGENIPGGTINRRHEKGAEHAGRLIRPGEDRNDGSSGKKSAASRYVGALNPQVVGISTVDPEWLRFIDNELLENPEHDEDIRLEKACELAEQIIIESLQSSDDDALHVRTVNMLLGLELNAGNLNDILAYAELVTGKDGFIQRAAARFPQIVGVYCDDEAKARLSHYIDSRGESGENYRDRFNTEWLAEINSARADSAEDSVAGFLYSHNDYAERFRYDETLRKLLPIVFGFDYSIDGDESAAADLFKDFYHWLNRQNPSPITALRVNEIFPGRLNLLDEVNYGSADEQIRSARSNIAYALRDIELQHPGWLELLDKRINAGGGQEDRINDRINYIADFLMNDAGRRAEYFQNETRLRAALTVLMGASSEELNPVNAANLFKDFYDSIGLKAHDAIGVKELVDDSLLDLKGCITETDDARACVVDLCSRNQIKNDVNWGVLLNDVARISSISSGKNPAESVRKLIADYLLAKESASFEDPELLKYKCGILAGAKKPRKTNSGSICVEDRDCFTGFCSWLKEMQPGLAQLRINRHLPHKYSYPGAEFKPDRAEALRNIRYVNDAGGVQCNSDWCNLLGGLDSSDDNAGFRAELAADYLDSRAEDFPTTYPKLRDRVAALSGEENNSSAEYLPGFVDLVAQRHPEFLTIAAQRIFPKCGINTGDISPDAITRNVDYVFDAADITGNEEWLNLLDRVSDDVNSRSLVADYLASRNEALPNNYDDLRERVAGLLGENNKYRSQIPGFVDYIRRNHPDKLLRIEARRFFPDQVDLAGDINSREELAATIRDIFQVDQPFFQGGILPSYLHGVQTKDEVADYMATCLWDNPEYHKYFSNHQDLLSAVNVMMSLGQKIASSEVEGRKLFLDFIACLKKDFADFDRLRAYGIFPGTENEITLTESLDNSTGRIAVAIRVYYTFAELKPETAKQREWFNWLHILCEDYIPKDRDSELFYPVDSTSRITLAMARYLYENKPDCLKSDKDFIAAIKVLFGLSEEINGNNAEAKNLLQGFLEYLNSITKDGTGLQNSLAAWLLPNLIDFDSNEAIARIRPRLRKASNNQGTDSSVPVTIGANSQEEGMVNYLKLMAKPSDGGLFGPNHTSSSVLGSKLLNGLVESNKGQAAKTKPEIVRKDGASSEEERKLLDTSADYIKFYTEVLGGDRATLLRWFNIDEVPKDMLNEAISSFIYEAISKSLGVKNGEGEVSSPPEKPTFVPCEVGPVMIQRNANRMVEHFNEADLSVRHLIDRIDRKLDGVPDYDKDKRQTLEPFEYFGYTLLAHKGSVPSQNIMLALDLRYYPDKFICSYHRSDLKKGTRVVYPIKDNYVDVDAAYKEDAKLFKE